MKKSHGGANRNQGRKSPFAELTKTTTFRIPISQIDNVKQIVKDYLQQFKKQ
jgi:hypothetical protein